MVVAAAAVGARFTEVLCNTVLWLPDVLVVVVLDLLTVELLSVLLGRTAPPVWVCGRCPFSCWATVPKRIIGRRSATLHFTRRRGHLGTSWT